MDSVDQMESILNEILKEIENYQNNALEGKYADSFQKLQEKMEQIKASINEIIELRKTTKLTWKNNLHFQSMLQYLKLLNFLANRYIRKGKDKELAEHTVLQNKFIQNYTMLDVISRQIDFYRESAKAAEQEFRVQYPNENISQSFLPIADLSGEKILIPNKNISTFEKLIRMYHDMEKVLENNIKQLQEFQDKNIEPEIEVLGDFYVFDSDINSEAFLLTDQEIDFKIEILKNNIQSLRTNIGKQKKYQFTIGTDHYQYVVPVAKKGEFINIISEMALYSALKQMRKSQKDHKNTVSFEIDQSLLATMNPEQARVYLENLLRRMESSKRKPYIKVVDHNGNEKMIPACFYRDYQKIVQELLERSFKIDLEKISNLSVSEQIAFYEKIKRKIEQLKLDPTVMMNDMKVPALLMDYYQHANECINQLKDIKEKLVDFDYAERLSEQEQLLYYKNAIGEMCNSNMMPKLPYDCYGLGQKIFIPTIYLMDVKQCEEKIEELQMKQQFSIDEEVSKRSPMMQIVYYVRLIEKMRYSKMEPKITVEAFGESFEIPEKAFDVFQECVTRMKNISISENLSAPKRYKIKNVRKSIMDKMKKMSSKLKMAIASTLTAGARVLTSLANLASSYHSEVTEEIKTVSEEDMNIKFENIASSLEQSKTKEENSDQKEVVTAKNNEKKTENSNPTELELKQKFCSQFGAVVLPIKNAVIHENPYDLSKPFSLKKDFQKVPCTIVKINVRMPDGQLFPVTYDMDYAQAYVDELLSNGGMVESVGVVSELSVENYKNNNYETGTMTLDQMNPIGNNTVLAEEIRGIIKENGVIK